MLNVLALVLSCCGDGGTVTPGPWVPSDGGGGSCSSCAPLSAQYWLGASASGLSSAKNLGALSTGLVLNTSGTPSQYAGTSCTNQFPRSLNNSGAATCASVSLTADVTGTLPEANGGTGTTALTCSSGQALTSNGSAYSCTSGPFAAGGSSPQVQYNNGGVLGGMTNYQSDGTRPLVVAETSIPSPPAAKALHFDLAVGDAGFVFPVTLDSMFTVPVPVGIRSLWASHSTSFTLHYQSHFLSIWGGGSATVVNNGTNQALTFDNTSTNTNAWDATSWKGRQKTTGLTSGATGNSIASIRDSNNHSWLGNTAGAGGFLFRLRTCIASANTHQRSFFGLANQASEFTATLEPSQLTNTIYFGCDNAQTTLRVCSNDNSGSATCSTNLGASFPCQTSGACYDFWLEAKPNASSVHWYVERLDSAALNEGDITSDLPQNSVQLSMHSYMNTADAGTAVRQDWAVFETLDNW